MGFVGFGVFFVIWFALVIGSLVGMICAVAALISISKTNADAFGPWWDNTKTPWLVGIAVGFVVPFGTMVTGVYWFSKGRAPLATTGLVARPFWVGPPKPPPPQPPWGYLPYPPYPQPQNPQPPYSASPPPGPTDQL